MIRVIKTGLTVILAFIMGVCTAVSAVRPPPGVKADSVSFDEVNVLEDLMSADAFDIVQYPFTDSDDIRVINFVEYCYSFRANMRDNYGLYVYVYNPRGQSFNTGNGNFIQMAISYDENGTPNGYEKFGLEFLNGSEASDYRNLFYKFKVIDRAINGTTFFDRVNSNERRYDVSSVELLTEGSNLATEYNVSSSYRFTGYAKGYGPDEDAESTLSCTVKELETITLETHSTYYRTDETAGTHNRDLTSVYFSVPDRFFETYGALQRIKAEWYEYRTTPIVITSNNTVYNLLYSYLGVNVYDDEYIPLQIYTGYQEFISSGGHYDKYDWAYNCHYTDEINTRCDEIDYVFSTEGNSISEYVLSSARLKNYIEHYDKSYKRGKIAVPGKDISADLFEIGLSPERASVSHVGKDTHHKLVDFDAGDSFNMLNYNANNTDWDRFFAVLFGFAPMEIHVGYSGISPIKIVTDEDMESTNLAKTLFINDGESELDAFRTFYNTAKSNGEKVVLFRFAETDYTCLPVMCYNRFTGKNLSRNYGSDTFVVQENVFMNFDVIELTFNKDGAYTVIPVVNNPIDIYNDITLPKVTVSPWNTFLTMLLLILLIVLLLVTGILPLIVKGVVGLVLLPFKGLVAVIKSLRKRNEN